jgi:hypothetical protein
MFMHVELHKCIKAIIYLAKSHSCTTNLQQAAMTVKYGFPFCRFSYLCCFSHCNLTSFSQLFIFIVSQNNIVCLVVTFLSVFGGLSTLWGPTYLTLKHKSSFSCEEVHNFRSIIKLLGLCCLILYVGSRMYVLTITSEFRNSHMDETHIYEKHIETWQCKKVLFCHNFVLII